MIAVAELERVVHEQLTGADVAPVQAAAERVIELGATVGDDAAMALAWRRISSARRRAGEYAAAEVAARRALEHARAARDSREEARAVDGLCNSLLYGPTPVGTAVDTCRELLAGGTTRTLEANVTGVMAGLQAMRGELDEAREAYRRAAVTLEELGLELARAALTQIGVPLELLAGDPLAAEHEARKGAEIFSRFGSSGRAGSADRRSPLRPGSLPGSGASPRDGRRRVRSRHRTVAGALAHRGRASPRSQTGGRSTPWGPPVLPSSSRNERMT